VLDKLGCIEFKREFFKPTGELIPISQAEWDESWVALTKPRKDDDDIPF
jgi:hypothetical protein